MIRVFALVEGPTERNFGQQVLAPHLGHHGVSFSPKVIGKPGHKGGCRWETAKREIMALLKQEPNTCTTMFDLYGLSEDWPGRTDAKHNALKKIIAARKIEQSIEADIASAMNVTQNTLPFFAYLSLHEYEALLFSDPQQLASVTLGRNDAQNFTRVVAECGGCEDINDDPQTAPSKRILQIAPRYRKAADGPIAAQRIGLQTMRDKCPHFNEWLTRLESLGKTQTRE
jgi:Domain of unknown function (DUF4276)